MRAGDTLLELVSKMVLSQPEGKKEGCRAAETRQTEGDLAILTRNQTHAWTLGSQRRAVGFVGTDPAVEAATRWEGATAQGPAHGVARGVMDFGHGAQWRELPPKYPPYQTCHRRFQQWVRSGALAKALRKLAQRLRAEGRLNLEEAFIDATFAAAKKGASGWVLPSEARGRRSRLSPLATVYLSP